MQSNIILKNRNNYFKKSKKTIFIKLYMTTFNKLKILDGFQICKIL